MKKYIRYFLAIFISFLFFCSLANAAIMGFTDKALFDAAIAGYVNKQTLDFESKPAGTIVSTGDTLEGITFNYTLVGGYDMMVTDFPGTTSGTNSLGTTDSNDAFIHEDSFDMVFDQTIHAIGLYVHAEYETIYPGDFALSVGSVAVNNDGYPTLGLDVGDGEAFFLGLVATDLASGFASATFSSTAPFYNYPFNIDDITTAEVPISSTLLLFGTGLLGLVSFRKKFSKS